MFLGLSVIVAMLAVFVFARKGRGVWLKAAVFLAVLLTGVLTALEIGLSLITGEGINDAVFYHLKTGLGGGDKSQYAVPVFGAIACLAVLVWVVLKAQSKISGAPTRSYIWNLTTLALAVAAIALHPVTLSSAAYTLRFHSAEQFQTGFYSPPTDLSLAAGTKPKNLILIYLESVERTYFDEERFPDLVPNLKALEAQSTSFTDMSQTIGTGFTIGGMVASQCGVPLILSGGGNSMRVNQFLSGADCMGDILSEANYQTAYLGGASIEFAGKGAFYKTHGFESVEGLHELSDEMEDPDYLAEWGLQDDTLFDLARRKTSDLAKQKAPFALTLLTLDTHHPNGHAETNKKCKDDPYLDGANPMLNSVKCVDHLAGQFIQEIMDSPEGQNTLIVVMSDHLALGNTATQKLNSGPRRNLFFMIDSSQTTATKIARAATTLDVAPTLLSALGFNLPRLGFGVDLQSEELTLPEELGISADDKRPLNRYILGFQSVFDRLWAYPDITDGLYANLEKGEVQLGTSAFGTPALLTFDATLAVKNAILGDVQAHQTLTEAVLELAAGTSLLWVDDCRALELLSTERTALKDAKTCFAHGKRGTGIKVAPLARSGFVSEPTLAEYLDSDGDTYLADFEQAKLEEIGRSRGELPNRIALPELETKGLGVLIQSSAFGAGSSFIRRQTSKSLAWGEDWKLGRGVTLTGIDATGRVEILASIDQCSGDFDARVEAPWREILTSTRSQFVAHVISVHDTAFCGDGTAIFSGPLAGLELPELQASEMRQAYVAVVDKSGRVSEFPNRTFPKLQVLLDPEGGELPVFAQLFADETPVAKVAAASTPQIPIVSQVSTVQTGDECKPPPHQIADEVVAVMAPDKALRGQDMGGKIRFQNGWWPVENAGLWSGSAQSAFDVKLPMVEGSLELVLAVAMYGAEQREIGLSYNGNSLGAREVDDKGTIAFDVSGLPKGVPLSLQLEAEMPVKKCPLQQGTGADPRALNFMLKSVELRVTDAAPLPQVIKASLDNRTCREPVAQGYDDTASTPLALGSRIALSDAAQSQQLAFGSGWWESEAFGSWMGSDYAELEMILPGNGGDLILEMEAFVYAAPTIQIEITHGATVIGTTTVGVGHLLQLDISDLPRGTPVRLGLQLGTHDPSCPANDGSSNDDRFLRLMVQSVGLRSTPDVMFGGAIAHAAGRLNGQALTNSFDALQANLHRFETFEIDFSWTPDDQLVCIHDWNESKQARFGDEQGSMTRSEFMQGLSETTNRPRNCDLDGLAGWMRANPDKRIVTDIKSDALKGHQLIASRHPDLLGQFIPQAYQPEEIDALKALGFRDVIWTLYKYPRDEQAIVTAALIHQPSAITMPFEWAQEGSLKLVKAGSNLPVLVHTINDVNSAACLKQLGAAAIYSDDLGAEQFEASAELDCKIGA